MLGNQIKSLRKARRITQTELAAQVGVTKQSVSNWENDNIQPSIDMLCKIAKYFGCTTDYLLELDNSSYVIETKHLTDSQTQNIIALIKEFEKLNNCKK